MKILVVGSKKDWAFENHYLKHLKPLCSKVETFAAHDMFYDYYYKSIVNKLLFRSRFSSIYKTINKNLLSHLDENKYDVVWVFKGMEIFPETLVKMKKRGIKLVNLNPDHPFVHTFRGSGNKNVLNSIPHFDLHLCYNLNVKKKIEDTFGVWCEWLPFGFERRDYDSFPTEDTELKRCCFIGNPDAFRAQVLLKIAESGLPLDLYGNNWNQWVRPKEGLDINYNEPVYKSDFDKVALKYRLHLNIFRPHNDNSHNMRTFEMPGIGCIILAPNSEEHQLLFKEDKEVFYYSTDEEMLSKASKILALDYSDALEIRNRCREVSKERGYDYESRAKEALLYFTKLL
ncbi:glycosyltransferase family protein [Winogradskyella costae]|uniref:glycosyltransferase family protein n=1 Tax=Winogradskyella costae TaxID=2697008 RepID=UPI0015CB5592|nr:glycosyltransferase [Winogradskyella costae]